MDALVKMNKERGSPAYIMQISYRDEPRGKVQVWKWSMPRRFYLKTYGLIFILHLLHVTLKEARLRVQARLNRPWGIVTSQLRDRMLKERKARCPPWQVGT